MSLSFKKKLRTRDFIEQILKTDTLEKQDCYKGYEIKELIAQGRFSDVYNACKANNCNYIVKKINEGIDTYNEIQIGHHLGKLGISPKIYAYWYCDGYYVVYKKINGLSLKEYINIYKDKLKSSQQFSDRLKKKIDKIVEKMHNNGISHNDLHHENILLEIDTYGNIKKVYIIDFGLSSVFNSPSHAKEYHKHGYEKEREEFYKHEMSPFLFK